MVFGLVPQQNFPSPHSGGTLPCGSRSGWRSARLPSGGKCLPVQLDPEAVTHPKSNPVSGRVYIHEDKGTALACRDDMDVTALAIACGLDSLC